MEKGHRGDPIKKPSIKLGLGGGGALAAGLAAASRGPFGADAVFEIVLGGGLLAYYVGRSVMARRRSDEVERFGDLFRLIDGETPVSTFPDGTVEVLDSQGRAGSDALAALIHELLACRSEGLIWALAVARRVRPSRALVRAVQAVLSAAPQEPGRPGRFAAEVRAPGQPGWTPDTASRIEMAARETLFALQSRLYSHPGL